MAKAINPDHYSQMPIEPIDVIESCKMDYHVASAVAYCMRGGRKGDAIDDYKKALNFLHRRIYGTWFTEPPDPPIADAEIIPLVQHLANRGRR